MSTPEKAGISRQRKMQTNPAEKKRKVRGSVDPNVSSWDRVKEFKDKNIFFIKQMSHVRQRYFMYQISILATFVLFEYHHVITYLGIFVI